MRILALDLSTSTGYAVLDDGKLIIADKFTRAGPVAYGKYPYSYINAAFNLGVDVADIVTKVHPDKIVIEETNGSKSRYTQKILEFVHYAVLIRLEPTIWSDRIVYVNTSDWRRVVGGHLSDADKKLNVKVSKAKKKATEDGKLNVKKFNKLKKELGVKGRINKKHVAIRVANHLYNLDLRPKDNDVADAICIATAFHMGINICDGKK